jgi:ABC-2 type transport system permease protein
MKDFFKEFRKHLRVHRLFAKTSLMQQLEYRANFIIGIGAECAWLASKLVYVLIVQQTGATVGGLSPDEVTLFIGTFILLTAIYTGLFMMNFFYIPHRIRNGELDLMIVKPISTQFHLTMRETDFAIPIPNIIGGFITIAVSWSRLGLETGLKNILIYCCLIISGTVLTYSIFLIPYMLAFWTVKVRAITDIADRMWDFNNMPMQIYGRTMQKIGIFIIPVFVIANFPVMALFNNLPTLYLLWGVFIPIVLFIIVKKIFDVAIKRYSSAGG